MSFGSARNKIGYKWVVGCAKINKMYLGNRLSGGLQILHGRQSTMASWLSEILATRPKAYPPQKHLSPHLLPKQNMLRFTACRDESRKDLTLLCTPNMHTNSHGNALSVGLQILQASEPNMALWF